MHRVIRLVSIVFGVLFVFSANVFAADKLPVFVTIPPQKYFVQQIGKELVDVQVMVQPGADPHTYEPKPRQMVALSKAKLYFAVGIEFEEAKLKKITATNPDLKIIHTDHGIEKLAMEAHHHHHEKGGRHREAEHDHHGEAEHDKDHHGEAEHDHHGEAEHDENHHGEAEHDEDHHGEAEHDEDHHEDAKHDEGHHEDAEHDKDHHGEAEHDEDHHGEAEHDHHGDAEHDEDHHEHAGLDPHIWLSPPLVKIQARTILAALQEVDPAHRSVYEANFKAFTARIDQLDADLKKTFAGKKGMKFMVFHPSWGYFAHAYGLKQEPIEIEGKDPKPAQMQELIRHARENGIKVVFVQPQFSTKSAELIASEIGGQVAFADPLAEDWMTNLRQVADKFQAALK